MTANHFTPRASKRSMPRRPVQILFHVVAAISLVLCLVVATCWVRSYRTSDTAGRWKEYGPVEQQGWTYVKFWKGRFGIVHLTVLADGALSRGMDDGYYVRTRPIDFTAPPGTARNRVGVDWQFVERPKYREWRLLLPCWLVVAVVAVYPSVHVWRVRRWRAARRLGENRCVRCGYDLRATPERCPECGSPAACAA
jgi:hypothetical protein